MNEIEKVVKAIDNEVIRISSKYDHITSSSPDAEMGIIDMRVGVILLNIRNELLNEGKA